VLLQNDKFGFIDERWKLDMFHMDTLKWTREPKSYAIKEKYFSFIVKTEKDFDKAIDFFWHLKKDTA
jgi:hypothetical protein